MSQGLCCMRKGGESDVTQGVMHAEGRERDVTGGVLGNGGRRGQAGKASLCKKTPLAEEFGVR